MGWDEIEWAIMSYDELRWGEIGLEWMRRDGMD